MLLATDGFVTRNRAPERRSCFAPSGGSERVRTGGGENSRRGAVAGAGLTPSGVSTRVDETRGWGTGSEIDLFEIAEFRRCCFDLRMDGDPLPGSADDVLLCSVDGCTVLDPAAGVVGAEELAIGSSSASAES